MSRAALYVALSLSLLFSLSFLAVKKIVGIRRCLVKHRRFFFRFFLLYIADIMYWTETYLRSQHTWRELNLQSLTIRKFFGT